MVILMTYEMADFLQELENYIEEDGHHLPEIILIQDNTIFKWQVMTSVNES